jgi:hypothetical protein
MEIYIDHAAKDPRSVKAWLDGRDDGRAMLYNVFRKKALKRQPAITDAEIDRLYGDALRAGWAEWNTAKLKIAAVVLIAYAIFWVWYLSAR